MLELPSMQLAVVLITADRYEYTKRTVESFRDYNVGTIKRHDIMLLHADDTSHDMRVRRLAKEAGFKLAAGTKYGQARRGLHAMRKDAAKYAMLQGATHIMFLENDFELVRQLPMDAADFVFSDPDTYCFRMYGQRIERDEISGLPRQSRRRKRHRNAHYDPDWMPLIGHHEQMELVGEVAQHAVWDTPPAITRIQHAVWLHDVAGSFDAVVRRSLLMTQRTARVTDNVFWHIGVESTPSLEEAHHE